MPKNIIICSDGTGNTAIKNRGTNVYKLFEAIDVHSKDVQQIAFYDDGIGTQRLRLIRIPAQAFGIGLRRNVRELYLAIARVYDVGDQIYFFGFSRGAFTVRMLAGLIARCGIADRTNKTPLEKMARVAWNAYRQRYAALLERLVGLKDTKSAESEIQKFRDTYSVPGSEDSLHFIGVWDTVDAYGVPFRSLAEFINKYIVRYTFPDRSLNPKVRHARQALAIDDERRSFHPLIWDSDERVKQVWFPGVHSDVGGGYTKHGLSLLSLDWMLEEIKACAAECETRLTTVVPPDSQARLQARGLILIEADKQYFKSHSNSDDMMHNPRSGLAVLYQYAPRNIAELCRERGLDVIVHDSAVRRARRRTQGYAPRVLPLTFYEEVTGLHAPILAKRRYGIDGVSTLESCKRHIFFRVSLQRLTYALVLIFCFYVVLAGVMTQSDTQESSGLPASLCEWLLAFFGAAVSAALSPIKLLTLLWEAWVYDKAVFGALTILMLIFFLFSGRARSKIGDICSKAEVY